MRQARWVVAVLFLVAGSAYAAESGGIRGTGRYGTAGCGLGSLAFGDQKGMIQVLAATTNGLFGTQTFGISSGTSNCQDSSSGRAGTKTFIEGNRDALAKDAARGSGETIKTLTALAGCKDEKAVGATLQKNFSALFPQNAPVEAVSDGVITTLRAEPSLACGSVG